MPANIPEVDGYSDLVEIGHGGFARVYRARQDRFKRLVAIKVLSLADPDQRTRNRFERECQAMGELSWHPHVVAVYDSGVTPDGHLWLAMEFLERGSLAESLGPGATVDWPAAVAVGVEVCGALGAAHAAGTLHRDLKPENLLTGPFGEAKLADFGIAAVDGGRRTTTGVASFTVAHVAPEVLRGHRPDERTDVYGLVSTLHTLIVGRPPFEVDPDEAVAAVMMRIIDTPAPRLGEPVPGALADLMVAALAKDPDDRPQSAASFGQALQQVQRDHGLEVTPLRLTPTGATTTAATPAAATTANPTVGAAAGTGSPADDHGTIQAGTPAVPVNDPNATIIVGVPDLTPAPAPAPVDPGSTPGSAAPPAPPEAPDAAAGGDGPPGGSAPAGGRPRWPLVAGAAALLLVVIVALAVVSSGGGGDSSSNDSDGSATSTAPDGGGAAAGEAVAQTAQLGTNPSALAVSAEGLWMSDAAETELTRIDPATDEFVTTTGMDTPGIGVTTTEGAVWVIGDSGRDVTRINTTTNRVTDLIEVGDDLSSISAVGALVWVTTGAPGDAGEAIPIDADTLEVGAPIAVGTAPNQVSATDDVVWVSNTGDENVSRIDPDTNQVTATVELDARPTGVSALEDAVWVSVSEAGPEIHQAVRIDPDSNEIVATVVIDGHPVAVAATSTAVWVVNHKTDDIDRIDPDTNEITDVVDSSHEPSAVAATDTDVWVANFGDGTLTHVDAAAFGT